MHGNPPTSGAAPQRPPRTNVHPGLWEQAVTNVLGRCLDGDVDWDYVSQAFLGHDPLDERTQVVCHELARRAAFDVAHYDVGFDLRRLAESRDEEPARCWTYDVLDGIVGGDHFHDCGCKPTTTLVATLRAAIGDEACDYDGVGRFLAIRLAEIVHAAAREYAVLIGRYAEAVESWTASASTQAVMP